MAYRNQAVSITYNTLKLRQVTIDWPLTRSQMPPLLDYQGWRNVIVEFIPAFGRLQGTAAGTTAAIILRGLASLLAYVRVKASPQAKCHQWIALLGHPFNSKHWGSCVL